jgi:hypothetical protein
MFMQSSIVRSLHVLAAATLSIALSTPFAFALPAANGDLGDLPPLSTPAAARSCKQVSTCEEAVRLWCGGYRRADGDGDGIPCENVCRTKEQVDAIRAAIGC